jgi:hypothetical protein
LRWTGFEHADEFLARCALLQLVGGLFIDRIETRGVVGLVKLLDLAFRCRQVLLGGARGHDEHYRRSDDKQFAPSVDHLATPSVAGPCRAPAHPVAELGG